MTGAAVEGTCTPRFRAVREMFTRRIEGGEERGILDQHAAPGIDDPHAARQEGEAARVEKILRLPRRRQEQDDDLGP